MTIFTSKPTRVLIGSPIQQTPHILREFLMSLGRLASHGLQLDYCLIDDNTDAESSKLLKEFTYHFPSRNLCATDIADKSTYVKNDTTHLWNETLIWKVAKFKNALIEIAIQNDYDYLFLIDSDILIHPDTIKNLVESGKHIVSEIFWTRWYPGSEEHPQVWLMDEYTQHLQQRGETLSDDEVARRRHEFFNQLRKPGLYEVGGLGACTLISRTALKTGVNFERIRNLSFWGEDRHFCVRALALGLSLYVDTHYPALHLYRDSDLERINSFYETRTTTTVDAPYRRDIFMPLLHSRHIGSPKITLSMVVKNEAGRYLQQVLEEHIHYIDCAVIIDDGSTDDTVRICREVLADVPLTIVSNAESKFSNEVELRRQQWLETINTKPEWILNLDADEMFERKFRDHVRQLANQQDVDVFCFRLYDFWNESHYRDDKYWKAHTVYRPFLIRYRGNFDYRYKEAAQHCGRFPETIFAHPSALSQLRLKHFGWATLHDRQLKYQRYMQLDPDAMYGWGEQYESILDEHPNLVEWVE